MDTFSDDNGARILVRHLGPAGPGVPEGGTTGQLLAKVSGDDLHTQWVNPPDGSDAVLGPVSAVDGNVALFDGVTGKLIKDSTVSLSAYATLSLVNTKVDKVTGKGLSAEDYTTVEKAKLAALSTAGYRGSFVDAAELAAFSFDPLPQDGDYVYLADTGVDVVLVLWDDINGVWTELALDPTAMTGAEIAAELYSGDDTYDNATCRIYTTTEKAQLASHESVISTFLGGGSGFQPLDATLTAFAGLVNSADLLPYFAGTDVMGTCTFTATARGLVATASVAAANTYLGLGTGNDVVFNSVKTAAPSASTAVAMKFGAVTAITDAGMVALGFTHQQQVDVAGTNYWVPLKSSAWA